MIAKLVGLFLHFLTDLIELQVWALRTDIHVLDHGGNLIDACCLSALAALMAFRKPEVSVGGVSGTEVIVHPPEVKEPLPLTIHHLPVAITFGTFEASQALEHILICFLELEMLLTDFLQEGNTIIIDPSLREEAAMLGRVTIMVNPSKEVCAVHKAGGVGISNSQLFRYASCYSVLVMRNLLTGWVHGELPEGASDWQVQRQRR